MIDLYSQAYLQGRYMLVEGALHIIDYGNEANVDMPFLRLLN